MDLTPGDLPRLTRGIVEELTMKPEVLAWIGYVTNQEKATS